MTKSATTRALKFEEESARSGSRALSFSTLELSVFGVCKNILHCHRFITIKIATKRQTELNIDRIQYNFDKNTCILLAIVKKEKETLKSVILVLNS